MTTSSNFVMKSVTSSSIARIGYARNTKELYIQFQSGKTYQYQNIPRSIVCKLKKADSIGSFFARNIRNKYTYL
jgi:hypothetical protein